MERLGIIVLAALSIATSFQSSFSGRIYASDSTTPYLLRPLRALLQSEERLIDIYKAAAKSVVYISTLNRAFNPILFNVLEIPSQTGSGFVWSDRFVVTNAHVVEAGGGGSGSVKIDTMYLITFLQDETRGRPGIVSYRAKLRGLDSSKDVAVLEIVQDASGKALTPQDATPFRPIDKGESKDLAVGQQAIAIGNPFGLDLTMTTGIVSGLGRTIGMGARGGGTTIFDAIQTDASINPGNSGGPLLDSSGRLIGMNTAIYTTSGSSSGVGFAIPVDSLKVWVSMLIQDAKIAIPKTGLVLLGGHAARALGVVRGVVVLSVQPGSSAAVAGIRAASTLPATAALKNDIILSCQGQPVDTDVDFQKEVQAETLKGGNTIILSVSRAIGAAGERKNVQLNIAIK